MSELFQRLIEKRGVTEDFLHPRYEDLADPFLLPDMEKAVERIKRAAEAGEKVLIYGDYDVDGVTASTAMYDVLGLVGVKERGVMLPDRFKDGYGMSGRVVERAVREGVKLVVTVDTGSRNHEIISELKEKGIDVVVTDHHECSESLPEAVAVVNPKRKDFADEWGMRDLSGVGVVFEVARAAVKAGILPDGQEKWLLDLVLIGTICDSMRIGKQNRIMTYWGMKVLPKTRRPGLVELMRLAKVTKINAEAIGFRIGPRLNAAGRLEGAEAALKLLMTRDKTEAARLAQKLEDLNLKRRDLQTRALREIRAEGVPEGPVIVATGEWPEGVLGIIAGKLVEDYERPAFVLSRVGEVWKGSGRSFGEFNLAEALANCADAIISGGGHAEACGLKVAGDGVERFRSRVNDYYAGLGLKDQKRFLEKRADLAMGELKGLDLDFLAEVAELEPYGEANVEPIFRLEGVEVVEVRKMGAKQEHLSLQFRGSDGGVMRLIAFGPPENWMRTQAGERVTALVRLVENEFRGLRSVEGELLELWHLA